MKIQSSYLHLIQERVFKFFAFSLKIRINLGCKCIILRIKSVGPNWYISLDFHKKHLE